MKKLICMALALGMLASVAPAGLAEEFFAEQENTEESTGDFFSEDFFAEGETIDVDESIPEVAAEETEEELQERSIVSVFDDVTENAAEKTWAKAPILVVKQKTNSDGTPVDGTVILRFVQEGLTAADVTNLADGTLKYYVYEIGEADGVARQVACVSYATTTKKIGKTKKTVANEAFVVDLDDETSQVGVGNQVTLTGVTEGKHTYFVRAEVRKTVNSKKKLVQELYGESSNRFEVEVKKPSTAWKKVSGLIAEQTKKYGEEGLTDEYSDQIAAAFELCVAEEKDLPDRIVISGFRYPVTLYKDTYTVEEKEYITYTAKYTYTYTANKKKKTGTKVIPKAGDILADGTIFGENNTDFNNPFFSCGIETNDDECTATFMVQCFAPSSAMSTSIAVTPKKFTTVKSGKKWVTKTLTGTKQSCRVDLYHNEDVAWKAQPVIQSAVQTGSGLAAITFTQDLKTTDEETLRAYWANTRFTVTGFNQTVTLAFTSDGALKTYGTYSKVKALKVSTYENDGDKYYVVEGNAKTSGTATFKIQPIQVKKVKSGKKYVYKTYKGTASAKKTLSMKAAASSAALNVSFGYVSGDKASLTFKCLRSDATSFKVTVANAYGEDATKSVSFAVAKFDDKGEQTVTVGERDYTITKSGTTYTIESFALSAGEYSCLIETYVGSARIVDKATCVLSKTEVVDAEDAPPVVLHEFTANIGGTETVDLTETNYTLPGVTLNLSSLPTGGDNNFSYHYYVKDENDAVVAEDNPETADYSIDLPTTEGTYTVIYEVWSVVESNSTTQEMTFKIGSEFTKGYFTYAVDGTNLTVASYNEDADEVAVPETVYYAGATYDVNKIGAEAFKGKSLSSVSLPNAIEEIGESAFESCTNLASMSCY